VSHLRRLSEAGIGAIVLHSLFEEQIDAEANALDRMLSSGIETAEAQNYFPDMRSYNVGPEGYLEHIRKAKQAVNVPIIGSLNGISLGGWLRYGRLIEQAGADALELNLYDIPTDSELPGSVVEQRYVDIVTELSSNLRIPLAVKIGPWFSSIPDMVRKLGDAGASAVAIFNRFYQPDFDLESLSVVPYLELSSRQELLLRLHWAAILFGNVKPDIAITGGVHTAEDVIKCMMAGARVAMSTSALLLNGIGHARRILHDLTEWLELHEYESIHQMQGAMSAQRVSDPTAFERANYMRVLGSYTLSAAAR
jgi:dihydroorotate dehydrogenase (fumarate)